MSFDFLSQQARDARTNLLQRQNVNGGLEFGGRFRHSIYGAGRAILRNRMMAFITQGAQPFSAISPHACQYDSDNVSAPETRHRLEKYINRWAIRRIQRK